MKLFLKIILILLFASLTPVLALLITFKTGVINPQSVKSQLKTGGIYEILVSNLTKYLDDQENENPEDNPLTLVAPYLVKEITPVYVETKTETLIDDTDRWLTGNKIPPPELSFNDLRNKIISENRNLVSQLKQMNIEYQKAKPEIKKALEEAARENPDITPPPEMPEINIDTILNKNLSVPVGSYISWLKPVVWLSQTGFIAAVATLILILGLIILLSNSPQSRLQWLSLTFFISGIWNILPLVISGGTAYLVTNSLTSNIPEIINPLVEALIKPVLITYTKISGIMLGCFIFSAFILFIISFLIPKPAVTPPQPPKIITKVK
jgi:hypothetical protein